MRHIMESYWLKRVSDSSMSSGSRLLFTVAPSDDAQIIARVADVAVKDIDDDLRKSALKLLKSLYTDST